MTSFYYKVFIINDMSAKEVALRKFLKDEAITGLENVEKLIRSFTSDGFSVKFINLLSRFIFSLIFLYLSLRLVIS